MGRAGALQGARRLEGEGDGDVQPDRGDGGDAAVARRPRRGSPPRAGRRLVALRPGRQSPCARPLPALPPRAGLVKAPPKPGGPLRKETAGDLKSLTKRG